MVSHELKTPLTPLKMYAEMLLTTNRLGGLNEKQLKGNENDSTIMYPNLNC